MVEEEFGVNIAVCPRLQLTSYTQETSPFENEVWEIYFYKEVCSFVHWSMYIMFAYIYSYICMRVYNKTIPSLRVSCHILDDKKSYLLKKSSEYI